MNTSALTIENVSPLRNARFSGKTVIALGLTILALAPLAVVGFGLLRGGVEPYIVLAALVLG